MQRVILAESAGFCYGVKLAVELAQRTAEETGGCWMLGDLIHNSHVVRDLAERGIQKTTEPGSLGSGDTVAVYAADPASDEADLAFDGAAGQNLDQAFFKINLDTSSLPDGVYLLAAAVRSGDKTTWSYFDDAISHFDIEQGVARLTSR